MIRQWPYFAGILLLITLDQLSKWYVSEAILRPLITGGDPPIGFFDWLMSATEKLEPLKLYVTDFFNLVMVWNYGISFGLFNEASDHGPLILIVIALVITVIFAVWLFKSEDRFQSIALSFVIAGAIGNVIDRARFGAVIDFLDFHIYGYHWPAFNVADSLIVVGVFILIIFALFFEKRVQ